jgi:hydroxyacyl-ACP dehydratase HTD2-like protein with hotdog domain
MALLTPDLLARIGDSAPPRTEIATRRDIRKYAVSTRQTLRKYLDGDVAPPLFHIHLFWEVVELDQLTPDGVFIDTLIPKLPLDRTMAGGLDIEYVRPIRAGDELTATRTLTDLYEKEGRSGPLIFYEVVTDVRTTAGDPVLREKATRLVR